MVTGIVGSRNLTVSAAGQQNHAGTTPMALRRDAGHALVEFAHRVYETFRSRRESAASGPSGWMRFLPGFESIVPGYAEMNLQFRDQDVAILGRLEAHAHALAEEANRQGGAEVTVVESRPPSIPALMNEGLRGHIEAAAERHAPGDWVLMPSAAVHDAQVLARHMPASMMFVPSIGGISHAFEEDTAEEDLVLGCQVFASAGRGNAGSVIGSSRCSGGHCPERDCHGGVASGSRRRTRASGSHPPRSAGFRTLDDCRQRPAPSLRVRPAGVSR